MNRIKWIRIKIDGSYRSENCTYFDNGNKPFFEIQKSAYGGWDVFVKGERVICSIEKLSLAKFFSETILNDAVA